MISGQDHARGETFCRPCTKTGGGPDLPRRRREQCHGSQSMKVPIATLRSSFRELRQKRLSVNLDQGGGRRRRAVVMHFCRDGGSRIVRSQLFASARSWWRCLMSLTMSMKHGKRTALALHSSASYRTRFALRRRVLPEQHHEEVLGPEVAERRGLQEA
jgi:hypothetical protein